MKIAQQLKVGCLLASLSAMPAFADMNDTRGDLSIGGHSIQVEFASTPAAQKKGLMFRTSLPEDYGMLFIYEAPDKQCMWMKNTVIPLSVAFIDEQAQIINIEKMKPLSKKTHCALREAVYALEMTEGWFQAREVKAGDSVSGLEKIGILSQKAAAAEEEG